MIDLEKHKIIATQKSKENKEFLSRLKKKKPKDLDDQFHDLHIDTFDKIDCLACANCCKTTSPIFYQKDIERVAKRLKMKAQDFINQYLHIDEDNDYVLNSAPCPFLDHENYCMVYEDRPTACREYPHTDRKRMYQILDLTHKNTIVCPAVLHIVDELKEVYK
jgi:Fe-S-cluster containining protein